MFDGSSVRAHAGLDWRRVLCGLTAPPAAIGSREPSILLSSTGLSGDAFGDPVQTVDRLAVRRLVVARTCDILDTLFTAYNDSVIRDYRLEYRLYDARP